MLHSVRQIVHVLVILTIVAGVLAGCGAEPTPVVVVVTRANTPEPLAQAVTATFTPTSEVVLVPSDTPLPTVTLAPSSTPPPTVQEPAEPEYVLYEHPSGTFSLQIPAGDTYETTEEGVYFAYGDSLIMVLYGVPDTPLDSAAMDAAIPAILNDALIDQGLINTYDDLAVEHNDAGNGAVASMTMTSDEIGDGEGVVALWQIEHVLYMVILLTPDYAAVEPVWETALDTLDVTPSGVPAPTAVPPTAVPPTATKKPKPTSPPPPTSPPTSNQGCYLFENHINAELTVTFTAQDRSWNDSFKIAAMGTKEYCLDPGRYTYTIDAPPPWNSINGELTVQAGDRYLWPIRGE
ncbi:MAG: hypothetical protein P8129_10740 [Anaerolineae bacterium]